MVLKKDPAEMGVKKMQKLDEALYFWLGQQNENSGGLRHGTCHFCTRYTCLTNVHRNLKDQMKLDLCICEVLSYIHVTIENRICRRGYQLPLLTIKLIF